MKSEVRLADREVLTEVLGVFENGKLETSGDVDTLDRIGPADFSEVGDRTTEREEFTLLVIFTVDDGAGHDSLDFEVSDTEGFITSTLIVVNVDLEFSRGFEVRNNDGDIFRTIIPTSTTNVLIVLEI